MAHRRAVVLVVLAAFLGLPSSAAATVSVSPALSYDGSYTVSWTDWSSGQTRAYLYQSFNGGTSSRTTVTGTYSRAYSGMSPGDYKYQKIAEKELQDRITARGVGAAAGAAADVVVIGGIVVLGSAAEGTGMIGVSQQVAARVAGAEAAAAGGTAAAAGAGAVRSTFDPNKLAHIFDNPAHNLGPVLQQFGGSQAAAFSAIKTATEAAVKAQGLAGVFETGVRIAGAHVIVRGAVVQGAVKIGTAFSP